MNPIPIHAGSGSASSQPCSEKTHCAATRIDDPARNRANEERAVGQPDVVARDGGGRQHQAADERDRAQHVKEQGELHAPGFQTISTSSPTTVSVRSQCIVVTAAVSPSASRLRTVSPRPWR